MTFQVDEVLVSNEQQHKGDGGLTNTSTTPLTTRIEMATTRRGAYRRKHHLRAAFRCGAFTILVVGAGCYHRYSHYYDNNDGGRWQPKLFWDGNCNDDHSYNHHQSRGDHYLRTDDKYDSQSWRSRSNIDLESLNDIEQRFSNPLFRNAAEFFYLRSGTISNDSDNGITATDVLEQTSNNIFEPSSNDVSASSMAPGNGRNNRSTSQKMTTTSTARILQNSSDNISNNGAVKCSDIEVASPTWMLTFYIIGVLYMFLALAIVCDEFFVPALEEMADEDHMNLSMDVAGATLMAAGGSAPELFTSFFGTFQENEIGIGTIVGSAVFNVLFVIACCAMAIPEPLVLTWWPLFRDCSFYVVGLILLAVFVGVISPGKIVFWEALVLFIGYIVYVVMMKYNERLYKLIFRKDLNTEESTEDDMAAVGEEPAGGAAAVAEEEPSASNIGSTGEGEEEQQTTTRATTNGNGSSSPGPSSAPLITNVGGTTSANIKHSDAAALSLRSQKSAYQNKASSSGTRQWDQLTFRAGILKLLRDPESWAHTAGVGVVSQVEGNAETVFAKVDTNRDGSIDFDELKVMLNELDLNLNEDQSRAVMREIDCNGDDLIQLDEFIKWYAKSEERMLSKIRHTFDLIDVDGSGTIDREELKALLQTLEPHCSDADVQDAMEAMYQEGSEEEITFGEFENWYKTSLVKNKQLEAIDEEMEGAWQFLMPPQTCGIMSYAKWILVLPILGVLTITVPDVRILHWGKFGLFKGKFCYIAFLISIAWIGVFSYFMVLWAEIIGNTIGIPSVIMGLTFLAAGTSVPDMLSSVIVAKRGEGDMAISSSIGSNIFDILVGLPLPWMIYCLVPSTKGYVPIEADGIWISILVLLGMVVLVIASIHLCRWKLTRPLGFIMFALYAVFLVQAIWQELPFEPCAQ